MSQYELRNYTTSRRAQYPTTYLDKHPSKEEENDYNQYKDREEESRKSIKEYDGLCKSMVGKRKTIHDLDSSQHSILVSPSAEAAMNSASWVFPFPKSIYFNANTPSFVH